ncbi:MAG: ferrous iron transport protein A [Nocardioidaceae bacterium]|nr:ferrous iron transport protein A [Nocardioidaceae bacterium]
MTRLDARGAQRRRLMDLGVLPGVEIVAAGTSPLGDPTAYVIRGALIALRRVQAKNIHIVSGVDR